MFYIIFFCLLYISLKLLYCKKIDILFGVILLNAENLEEVKSS